MKISLITPAPPRSRAGNRATAARWANILRRLGTQRRNLCRLQRQSCRYDDRPYMRGAARRRFSVLKIVIRNAL